MIVRIKDRSVKIETVRMALNMVGIGVDYIQTDLILKTTEAIRKDSKNFNVQDALDIQTNHSKEWEKYIKNIKNESKSNK